MPLTTYTAGEVLTASSLNDNLTYLDGKGSGLVCVKAETAFSAASSVTADGVFTSAYTNYRVLVRYNTSTSNNVSFKLRAAAVDTSTNYNFQVLAVSSTSVTGTRSTSQTSAEFGQNSNGSFFCLASLEISGPQLAEPTVYTSTVVDHDGSGYTTPSFLSYGGNQSSSTAFDGINLLVATGTMTGSYTIYGYSKAV